MKDTEIETKTETIPKFFLLAIPAFYFIFRLIRWFCFSSFFLYFSSISSVTETMHGFWANPSAICVLFVSISFIQHKHWASPFLLLFFLPFFILLDGLCHPLGKCTLYSMRSLRRGNTTSERFYKLCIIFLCFSIWIIQWLLTDCCFFSVLCVCHCWKIEAGACE